MYASRERRLLIISHTPHHRRCGQIVGFGATVREIDHLATSYGEVRHVAFLEEGIAPATALAYSASNVRLIPVPATGGPRFRDKIDVTRLIPRYLRTISRELAWADVVHVRCPSSIGLLAVLVLAARQEPTERWIKYAGNWRPTDREPSGYTVQRWLLRRNAHRGMVTVNGRWPDQAPHVRSFDNPCLTDDELEQAGRIALHRSLEQPVRLLFVGRIEEAKGVGRTVEVLKLLVDRQVDAKLEIIGDGPDLQRFDDRARELEVRDRVVFRGWLPRPAINESYARSHFIVHPSTTSEGWPKVLSEAMAFGVVPVASAISSIPHYIEDIQTGGAIAPKDTEAFANLISDYLRDPELWQTHSANAARGAWRFTYSRYLESVAALFEPRYKGVSVGETVVSG